MSSVQKRGLYPASGTIKRLYTHEQRGWTQTVVLSFKEINRPIRYILSKLDVWKKQQLRDTLLVRLLFMTHQVQIVNIRTVSNHVLFYIKTRSIVNYLSALSNCQTKDWWQYMSRLPGGPTAPGNTNIIPRYLLHKLSVNVNVKI